MAGPTTPVRVRARRGNHRGSALGRLSALAAATLLGACGGSTSTLAPTVAPTINVTPPPPSPTPFDVGAAFLAIVGDEDLSAKFEMDGTIEMGVTVGIEGSFEGDGDNMRQRSTVTFNGNATTTEAIKVGSERWSRTLPGPWLAMPASSGSSASLNDWLGSLSSLTDLGVETKAGQQLHHLRPAAGSKVPPEALGLDPDQFTDPDISIELYARDDGTPALFEMTGSWVQKVNQQDVNVELDVDMTVSDVGEPVTITRPTDVWTQYTSELGYSVAHPAGFTVVSDDEGDTFRKDDTDWFYVFAYPEGKGLTAKGFTEAIIDSYAEDPGPPRSDPKPVAVGGTSGYRADFELTNNEGGDILLIDVLTVFNDLGWEISLVTTPELEAEETKIFESFLASFKFLPPS